MKARGAASTMLLCAVAALACEPRETLEPGRGTQTEAAEPVPSFYVLEGEAEDTTSEVVRYSDGGKRREVLGRVPHAAGAARHGVFVESTGTAYVVVRSAEAPRDEDYGSELWAVSAGHSQRLLAGLVDAASVLRSPSYGLVVQRGTMGPEAEATQRGALAERSDRLVIDRLEPETGRVQTVWEGHGQLAWPALLLSDSAVLLEHIHNGQAELITVDLSSGNARSLGTERSGIARDFTLADSGRELRFVRPSQARSAAWLWIAKSLASSEERILAEGEGPMVAPRTLGTEAWLVWDSKQRTLVVSEHGSRRAFAQAGSAPRPNWVRVLGQSNDGTWLAVEARYDHGAEFQLLHGSMRPMLRMEAQHRVREFLGFAAEARE